MSRSSTSFLFLRLSKGRNYTSKLPTVAVSGALNDSVILSLITEPRTGDALISVMTLATEPRVTVSLFNGARSIHQC